MEAFFRSLTGATNHPRGGAGSLGNNDLRYSAEPRRRTGSYRNCIEPAHLAWFREDLWPPMTNDTASADWIVAYSPQSRKCVVPDGFKRVFTVDVPGATLAEVWQR